MNSVVQTSLFFSVLSEYGFHIKANSNRGCDKNETIDVTLALAITTRCSCSPPFYLLKSLTLPHDLTKQTTFLGPICSSRLYETNKRNRSNKQRIKLYSINKYPI